MKNVTILSIIFLMLMLSVGTTQAQDSIERNPVEETIMRYINAINMRDYETAYNMLAPENQTYEQFVAGYAETAWITPYMGVNVNGGGGIRTYLLAYQTNGSVESYSGVFDVTINTTSDPNINIINLDGSFNLVQSGFPLTNATIMWGINGSSGSSVGWLLSPNEARLNWAVASILNYFNAINQGRFEAAYQRWHPAYDAITQEQVMPQSFRPPFEQFVSGYNDTAYITVYAQSGSGSDIPYRDLDDPAYVSEYIRIVLVAQKTDGSFETYSGCYAFGRTYRDYWRIINGRFTLIAETVPNTLDILATLFDLDCTTLDIPM